MNKNRTVEQKVVKFTLDKKLINDGDKVLIALSGGPDSVFLLEILTKYKKKFDIRLGTFHLNHNLRGKASKADKEFCERLSSKYKIPFYYASKKVALYAKKNKISIEEAGREIRYKELIRIAKKNSYTKIATGHNLNDNAETMLLNFIKGSGTNGLSGISEKRDMIIRPILALSKQEIVNYLQIKKIEYRIDSSNLQNDYQRNYLRNEIIPLIRKKINPQFDTAVLKTSEIMKNVSSFINEEVGRTIKESSKFKNNSLIIDANKLKSLNENLIGSLFQAALKKYFGIEAEQKNIFDLQKLLDKQSGKRLNLTNKIIAFRERNSIIIFKEKINDKTHKDIPLKIGEKRKVGNVVVGISMINSSKVDYSKSRKREYVDAEKIKSGFVIRRWRPGECFHPLGMQHSKKISDFLNEQKIPSYIKKEQLVLTESGNIVWIVGIRIDNRYALTEKTRKVLELCLN